MLGSCISPGDRRNDLNVTRFQVHEFLSGGFNGFELMRADFNATVKSFCDRRTRFRNSENQSNGVFFEDRRHICGSPCGCGSIAHKTFFQVNRPVSVDALVSHRLQHGYARACIQDGPVFFAARIEWRFQAFFDDSRCLGDPRGHLHCVELQERG